MVALACSVVGFGVGRLTSARSTPIPEPVVARWKGGGLSAETLRAELSRRRDRSPPDVIRDAVLAAEARRRGLDADPKVQGPVAEALAARLSQLEADALARKGPPSAAEAEAFYRQHLAEFVHPERLRFTDAGSFTREELEAWVGPAAAADAWSRMGFGELIDAGTVVLRIEAREGERNLSLEQARPFIESRLWYARRDAELKKLYDRVAAELELKVDDAAVQNVVQSAAQAP